MDKCLNDFINEDPIFQEKLDLFISKISNERKEEIRNIKDKISVDFQRTRKDFIACMKFKDDNEKVLRFNLKEYMYWISLNEERKNEFYQCKGLFDSINNYENINYVYQIEKGLLKDLPKKPEPFSLKYFELTDPKFQEKLNVVFSTITEERKNEIKAYKDIAVDEILLSLPFKYNCEITREDKTTFYEDYLQYEDYLYWICLNEERKNKYFEENTEDYIPINYLVNWSE